MKAKTKSLIVALCTVLLVAGSVMGTLAYLTDTQEVVNTFTVGDVDIKVDEAPVNPDGTPIPDEDRVEGNEYHLIPGQTYTKDPTMTVLKGSEESYVRMMVTINCISELRAILGEDFLPQNYVGYLASNNAGDYMPKIIISTLKGIVNESDNRISRILFKLAVEQAISMNVIAATCNISRDQLD